MFTHTHWHTHIHTHTNNNNSKESVNSRLSLLSLCWVTNHTRHRGWLRLQVQTRVSALMIQQSQTSSSSFCTSRKTTWAFDETFPCKCWGKGTMLLLSLNRFFFQAEEKRRIKLDKPWSFFPHVSMWISSAWQLYTNWFRQPVKRICVYISKCTDRNWADRPWTVHLGWGRANY